MADTLTRDPRDIHLDQAKLAVSGALLELWSEWDLSTTEIASVLADVLQQHALRHLLREDHARQRRQATRHARKATQ